MTGRALIVQGDALHLPLPDESVDLVVSSPPYWSLRSYGAGPGEIGSESTPQLFLEALWAATAEMARVLRPGGSIFVNLGDKYDSSSHNMQGIASTLQGGTETLDATNATVTRRPVMGRPKSLMLLPERYRVGCVDRLGLIARAVIVWCLSGGARVYARLPTGDRPIMLRDLARHYQPEQVQLWNGHQWTQVLGWNRTPDDDGALELEFRSGERVGCTPGHQWPTTEGLKRADALRVGDVVLQTALPEPDRPHYPAGLHADDIGWLVGLYIAEGSRSEATIQISGHLNETARHTRLAQIAEAYDGTCHVYQTSENGSTCNLTGPVLLGILDQYVSWGTAKTKRLRKAAWQRSNQFLAAVVEGYLDGDGSYEAKNQRWRVGFTANDEWAADLRTLAARLGAQLRLRRRTTSYNGRVFPGWGGDWRWQRSVHHNAKPDTEIMAIRFSRARDFYDLGVADEPHLFALASGVLTHNSKPNGLPESVTDRVRRSHEDWVHLTREPRYYSATDEIREPQVARAGGGAPARRSSDNGHRRLPADDAAYNPLGKLPGSVWTIPSEPLTLPGYFTFEDGALQDFLAPERGSSRPRANGHHSGLFDPDPYAEMMASGDAGAWRWMRATGVFSSPWPQTATGLQLRTAASHYAAFPSRWPEQLIKGFSPPGICVECGQGRVPVVERTGRVVASDGRDQYGAYSERRGRGETSGPQRQSGNGGGTASMPRHESTILGYACSCTPHTDHPGSGEPGPRGTQPWAGNAHSSPRSDTNGGFTNVPRTGPWREWHLDRWTAPPTRPAVILDPFAGVGTTVGVAKRLGRIGIGVDLSGPYCRAARWRVNDPDQFGKVEGRSWRDRQGQLL